MFDLLYIFAYLLGWLGIFAGRLSDAERLRKQGNYLLAFGLVVHGVWLVWQLNFVKLDGAVELNSVFHILGLLCIMAYLALDKYKSMIGAGLVMPPFALFIILLGDSMSGFELIGRLGDDAETYRIPLLVGHIFFNLTALLAFTFSALFSLFFLIQESRLKAKTLDLKQYFLPSLAFSKKYSALTAQTGFLLYTIGLILGFGTSPAPSWNSELLTARVTLPLTIWWFYGVLIVEQVLLPKKNHLLLWHNIVAFLLCIAGLAYEISFLSSF